MRADYLGTDCLPFMNHIAADINRIVPSVQSLLGLCWEMNFAEDQNHISVLLAYENSYWWRQNQLIRLEKTRATPPYGTRLSEDLGSQGLTFDVSLFFLASVSMRFQRRVMNLFCLDVR